MQPDAKTTLERRQDQFENFYNELMPSLVYFLKRLGIEPAHEVLNHASAFKEPIAAALQNLVAEDDADRIWLISRVGYFIGEYFAQKFSGHWFVNDVEGSKFFARYVVGRFTAPVRSNAMIDPFDAAQAYVDSPVPRRLDKVLNEIEHDLSPSQ